MYHSCVLSYSPQMFTGLFPERQKGNAAFCIFQDASSAAGFIPHPAHSAETLPQLRYLLKWSERVLRTMEHVTGDGVM